MLKWLSIAIASIAITSVHAAQIGVTVATTQAQIPSLMLPSDAVMSLYRMAGDLGDGCTYSSVNATSTGWGAVQSQDGTWFNLTFPSGIVNPKCFGAYGSGGNQQITSTDIANNPQWRGAYAAGQTWDYVATQEAIYAAFAGASTPGSIVWNAVAGTIQSNLKLYIPNGTYSINAELVTVAQGFTIEFQSRQGALWNWTGPVNTTMWLCNSCDYGEIVNPSLQNQSVQSYGSVAPIWVFDHSSSPGGLKTQQLTIYDAFISLSSNGRGIGFNPASGGSGQGDTVTWINPVFLGYDSDYAVQINGGNAIDMVFLHGDCQGFTHYCIENNGGSFFTYGMHFENQNNSLGSMAPVENQVVTGGADAYTLGQNTGESSAMWGTRSEAEVLSNAILAIPKGTSIDNGMTLAADTNAWFANYSGYLEGNLISPGTPAGLTFATVDGGGTTWGTITSANGDTFTDSTQNWTVNQWAGYTAAERFGSNGFTQRCPISSNTATTVTTSCVTSTASMYQIIGKTGAAAPNWASAAPGYQAAFLNTGQGVTTAIGSNQVGVGSEFYSAVTVGDYLIIPYGDELAPAGQPAFPMALYAKVTAKSSTPCNGENLCLTISKNANLVVTNAEAYGGTPIIDNQISWINVPYDVVAGAQSVRNFSGPGLLAGIGSPVEGYTAPQANWLDTTFGASFPQPSFSYSAAGTPLPPCNAANQNARATVSDALSPTYLGAYVSGGSAFTPVVCNGSNWITN